MKQQVCGKNIVQFKLRIVWNKIPAELAGLLRDYAISLRLQTFPQLLSPFLHHLPEGIGR
jgi:hypothetical protein